MRIRIIIIALVSVWATACASGQHYAWSPETGKSLISSDYALEDTGVTKGSVGSRLVRSPTRSAAKQRPRVTNTRESGPIVRRRLH